MFTLTIGVQVYVVGSPKKFKAKKPCLRLKTGMRSRSRPEQAFFLERAEPSFCIKAKNNYVFKR